MPYKLKKAPKQDKYWVVKKSDEKRKFSKRPLSRKRALSQMRAIIINEMKRNKK